MYTDQFRQSVKQNMLPTSACEIDTKIMGGGGGGGGKVGRGGGGKYWNIQVSEIVAPRTESADKFCPAGHI